VNGFYATEKRKWPGWARMAAAAALSALEDGTNYIAMV
jgi:hypothetical protein